MFIEVTMGLGPGVSIFQIVPNNDEMTNQPRQLRTAPAHSNIAISCRSHFCTQMSMQQFSMPIDAKDQPIAAPVLSGLSGLAQPESTR
jgi:hypothetical protein